MVSFNIGNLFSSGGTILNLAINFIVYGIIGIAIIAVAFIYYLRKKKWYITVIFQLPRSDNKIINAEIGKGRYNIKRGVFYVKRKGLRASPLKPFDVKRYLQGNNILSVVQTGINDYKPILNESYINMVDDETGEEAALLKVRMDTTESAAWKSSFEREAKNAFSLSSILEQFLPYIGWGIVIFLQLLGFSILWTRIAS